MFAKKKSVRVARLMSKDPKTCGTADSAGYAAQIMWDHDCGCVPVVDGEGRVIGMLTDRDICMAALTQGKSLNEIPVASILSHAIITVNEADTVDAAEEAMRKHRVRRVPVVDGARRPVGILSLNDIARRVTHGNGIDVDTFVSTMAAICEPPAPSPVRR